MNSFSRNESENNILYKSEIYIKRNSGSGHCAIIIIGW